jgi:hypothetical protein
LGLSSCQAVGEAGRPAGPPRGYRPSAGRCRRPGAVRRKVLRASSPGGYQPAGAPGSTVKGERALLSAIATRWRARLTEPSSPKIVTRLAWLFAFSVRDAWEIGGQDESACGTWRGGRCFDPRFIFLRVCARRASASLSIRCASTRDRIPNGRISAMRPRLALGPRPPQPLGSMGTLALRA